MAGNQRLLPREPSAAMQQVLGSTQKSWMTAGNTPVAERRLTRPNTTSNVGATHEKAIGPPLEAPTLGSLDMQHDLSTAAGSIDQSVFMATNLIDRLQHSQGGPSPGSLQVSSPQALFPSRATNSATEHLLLPLSRPIQGMAVQSSPRSFVEEPVGLAHGLQQIHSSTTQPEQQNERLSELAARYGGVEELEKRLRLGGAVDASPAIPERDPRPHPGRGLVSRSISNSAAQAIGASNLPRLGKRVSRPIFPRAPTSSNIELNSQSNSGMQDHLLGEEAWNSIYQSLYARLTELRGSVATQLVNNKELDETRLLLLLEACNDRDVEYLLLHQIYCLNDLSIPAPRRIDLTQMQLAGIMHLKTMLLPNQSLPSDSLTWYTNFPPPIVEYQVNSQAYRNMIQYATDCLIQLGLNYEQYSAQCMRSGFPPLVNDMESILGVTSATLQGLIFKAIVIPTWPHSADSCSCFAKMTHIFRTSQAGYRHWKKWRAGIPTRPSDTEKQQFHLRFLPQYANVLQIHKSHLQHIITAGASLETARVGPRRPAQVNIQLAAGQETSNQVLPIGPRQSQQFIPPPQHSVSSDNPILWSQSNPVAQVISFPIAARQGPISSSIGPSPHSPNHGNDQRAGRPAPENLRSNRRTSSSQVNISSQGVAQQTSLSMPTAFLALYPPHGYVRQHVSDPPSKGFGLHQAHLQDPEYTSAQRDNDNEETRWYSYFRAFSLNPCIIRPETAHFCGQFFVMEDLYKLIPQELPEDVGTSKIRKLYPGSVIFRIRCVKSKFEGGAPSQGQWAMAGSAWPSSISINFNGSYLDIRRKYHHGKDLPLDITTKVKPGENKVKVALLRDVRAVDASEQYFIAVEIIEFGDAQSLERLVSRAPAAITKRRIQQQLASNDDEIQILTKDLVIGVLDPFTARQVQMPVRGKSCLHYECFDFEVFLRTRGGNPCNPEAFKCPICGGDARPQTLVLDEWFELILGELKREGRSDANSIVVDERAEWIVKEEIKEGESGDGLGQRQPETSPSSIRPDPSDRDAMVIELD